MPKRKILVLLTIVGLVAFSLPALADAGPDAAGIYKAKCAMCHGADGAGQTPTGKAMKVRDLRSPEVQKMSDKDLAAAIRDGKGKMTAFKGKLSEPDIEALVGFIRALKK